VVSRVAAARVADAAVSSKREPVDADESALPEDWRTRLRTRLLRVPDHTAEHCRFGSAPPGLPERVLARLRAQSPAELTAAAVLVPIIERPTPTLLLTVRASHLRHHAGQISFPGGALEDSDADIAAAALRETAEELGIDTRFIEPLGFLSDHIVITGFRVTPVVGLLQPSFTLQLQSREVAETFELPLSFALAATNYQARRRTLQELEFEVWDLPYGERNIWGATAGILAHLREVLGTEDA
jgi:8-oxo-dGTP pyrophosphatase MutT (NUDIX family)